jgi:glucosamine--fructose-6-phosphate aminotransferase (isomerizing)
MCGIIAILGKSNFKECILSGLKLLMNRGFDSTGICYVENNELNVIKYASTKDNNSIEFLENEMNKKTIHSSTAIGHVRWSTHGPPTDINAHPHNDNKNRISLVHNGIIENYKELKEKLSLDGYFFTSQTDTEVIAVMIGYYLDIGEEMNNAVKKTIENIRGTWALTIIHQDYPNHIWITRNGSPLLIGLEEEYVIIASEQIAFGNHVKKYIVLNNNDLIEIVKDSNIIKYNKNIHHYKIKNKEDTDVETHPSGFDHWLIKEISEQPDSINAAINNGGRIESNVCVKLGGLDTYKSRLMELNHIILLGCGTSYYSGMWATDIFKQLDIFDTVSLYDGAEFNMKDIPKKGKSGIIFISQSGETKDLQKCIQIAKDFDLIKIGVVNVVDSTISLETECGVYLNAGREVSVASTKSFTNQCVVLTMIGVWFSQNKGTCLEKRRKIISDLRNLSFQMGNVINECNKKIDDIVDKIIYAQKPPHSLFLLGKGQSHAIALEGALKIKEITYIHGEGYSSGALKHGPFTLINENCPVILFDIDDEFREKNNNCYQEIKARNAVVIKIADTDNADFIIDKNKNFGGLLANCAIQILCYRIALKLGHNPDYPKNLAKVVTVE